jgi:leucyl-tRNA synthetase
MLSPFSPHTMEELWQMYGHADGLIAAQWPAFDAEVAKAEELEMPLQVNGKLRDVLRVSPTITDEELTALALANSHVQAHTAGKQVTNVKIVKGRLVSIVAK